MTTPLIAPPSIPNCSLGTDAAKAVDVYRNMVDPLVKTFQGDQCVDDIAARYLIDAAVPSADTRCTA